ncbi:Dual oxidase maturation factor 1 [Chionoecetes opilio]|uniref:Dual oxidase maturation factor 1 n=1 Tax=Chionoecetes opilio TaxID=41210 RepID=A0A8J4YQK0_CHIOP|nr:Dual oxidase maturation factor 1 [Chionoecetes opilio]
MGKSRSWTACNFGQEWEVGVIRTGTPYRAGTGQEIKAQIGIHLGLRSLNITLKAGSFQRAFRHAQEAGLPLPILWVAEYFILDGEGIRFGRHYRYSGWYAHICVWTAFPLYLLTIILFKMVIRMAAQTLILTGTLLTSASLIWAFNRNHKELQIPFEDGMLTTKFGIHWYLSLVMGTLCITLGLAIYLYDLKYPGNLSWVFGNDPLSIVEQVTTEEEGKGEEGEEKVAQPDQTPTAQKKRMKMAGRRVVTTLKVFGTKHCLKKMTHTSSENWHLLTRSREYDDDDDEG